MTSFMPYVSPWPEWFFNTLLVLAEAEDSTLRRMPWFAFQPCASQAGLHRQLQRKTATVWSSH